MTIKQPKGSGSCAVCVAAMATNTTTEDVYKFFNDGRVDGDPIHDPEIAMYLLKHGWLMGRGFQFTSDEDWLDRSVDSPDKLHLMVQGIQGERAYLSVKSRNYEGVGHAVYWDGNCVRDPDPSMPDEVEIGEYNLLQIWPLTWMGFTDLTGRIMCEPKNEPPHFVKRYRDRGPNKGDNSADGLKVELP